MGERVAVRLGDVADVSWGDTTTTKASYVACGKRAFSASGPDGFLDHADYSETGIVVSAIGAQCGRSWLARGEWSCIKNTIRILSRDPRLDIEYLYWLLQEDNPWPQRGSAQPFISQTDARNVRVLLPPLSEQRAIAEVLGALDDKIEANRRVARLLEQLLSAMFLQFGFDEVDNLGVDVVRLSEIIEVNPPRKIVSIEVAPYIDMPSLPTDSALVTKPAFRKPKSGARFVNGDTLMARISPCLENGKVAFVDCLANGEVGTGSTEFLVLRPREPLPAQFAYFLARSERFLTYAIQHMSGSSGRQRCPAEAIERYNIAPPDARTLASFGDLAGPAFATMRATVNESIVLADLLDTLLPKLLSGELRVRDAEPLVEEVV
jgi:type I restriction enzyme S subunit